jgi:DNA-binding CsgD family transcriptional regulator
MVVLMGLPCNTPQQQFGIGTIIPLDEVKRLAIVAALDICEGDYQLAARLLCIGKTTLHQMARKYNYHAVAVQVEALVISPPLRTPRLGDLARQGTRSQVVELLLQGCQNSDIARQLNITCRAVKSHFNRLFRHFEITSGNKRVQLATLLFRRQRASK